MRCEASITLSHPCACEVAFARSEILQLGNAGSFSVPICDHFTYRPKEKSVDLLRCQLSLLHLTAPTNGLPHLKDNYLRQQRFLTGDSADHNEERVSLAPPTAACASIGTALAVQAVSWLHPLLTNQRCRE